MQRATDIPRTALTVFFGVVATLIVVPALMVLALINDTSPWIDRLIRTWSRVWLFFSNTKLDVRGQEHIDPTKSYVVVANHLSALDIMACFLAVPVPIRYLAKKELFSVPVLAQGMRAIGIVEVDRSGRAAIHAAVNRQAQQLLEKGRSLIIYAEGTRPRNGIMTRFKKGAFTMAIASGLPVLPVSIHGSYEAWPPAQPWIHGGTIEIVIDPPIETSGMTHADSGKLRDRVHDLVAEHVTDMGGEVRAG